MPTPPRKLRWLLVMALVSVNMLVCLIAANSLYGGKQLHEKAAEHLTQNIANALDLNVSTDVQIVDLALRSVVDELQHQLSERGIREAPANTFLGALEQRLPQVEAIRVARADGVVILGKGVSTDNRVSWADRPSFLQLRDHPGAGLEISGPVLGRVSQQYVVGFSRRFNHPDGSFAGVVTAAIALNHFTELLSRFDVGQNGTLILRDSGLGLIARVPALPNHPSGQLGNQVVSPDFRKVFDSGADSATSVTQASPDGFRRIFTFRRLSVAPMVAIVASAQQDYLAPWIDEVYRTAAIVGGFLLLSGLTGVYLQRLMLQNEKNVRQIDEAVIFAENILDSLTDHIVVIDTQGVIAAANASWRRFAQDNGAAGSAQVSIGANYLAVCSGVPESPHTDDAQRAHNGIKAVIDGTQKEYRMEYACHSPTEQRWFILHVLPLSGSPRGAVIIHQNVTQIHLAQAELKASEDKFRLIAQNTSDGLIVFDASQRIQYVSPAYITQLGYSESDELQRTPDAIYALLHPEDRDQVFASIYAAMQAKMSDLLYSYRVRHKDGHFIWREDHARFEYDDSGVLCNTYVICRDITGRKTEEDNRRIMSDRLQELSRRLVQAQEHARRKLARELHELTSPNLDALRINLAILTKAAPAALKDQDFADRMADTRALIDDTTCNIRDICAELYAMVPEGGGMVGVVQNYAQQFAKRTDIRVSVHCAHEEAHLAPALALPLFRIVQEALTNCAKHAQAQAVDITLQLASLPMQLVVSDDGIGFDPNQAQRTQSGLGLINMRETAEFVGGTLSIRSGAGAGTTICVDIATPLQESAP
jgi:PAS domain S-box-containing protein